MQQVVPWRANCTKLVVHDMAQHAARRQVSFAAGTPDAYRPEVEGHGRGFQQRRAGGDAVGEVAFRKAFEPTNR